MDSKKSDLLMHYQEYAEFQFAVDGEGLGLRSTRQALAERGTAQQTVCALDELVIEAVQIAEYINPALLDDPHDRPLPQWWWHLGKLRAGTYPAELLPPHLQAMYRQGQRQAA